MFHEMKKKTPKIKKVFLHMKHSKFWSIFVEHFIEHKPLFLKSALMLLYLLEEIEVLLKFLSHFNICYIYVEFDNTYNNVSR